MNENTSIIRTVLDANVLFSMPLCDLFMRAGLASLYEPRWSAKILDEMETNLVLQKRTDAARARNRRLRMEDTFPTAMIAGYEPLLAHMTNDPNDRHVLAAAIQADAFVIVTHNTRHFPKSALAPHGVAVRTPDTFLRSLLDTNPATVIELVRDQAANLTKPRQTFAQVLTTLQVDAPTFVYGIRAQMVHQQRYGQYMDMP